MGEDQANKQHVCKFCKKSFLCGRSLGGHMRSHMMNNNNNTSSTKAKEKQLHKKKKKVFSSSVNGEKNEEEDFEVGYALRENPKKSWRYSDSSDETLNQDMICKECGKGFQSWKALFGHMRCHSERDNNKISNTSLEEEEDDSWTTGDQIQKQLIMDSQSDNEATAAAPRRRMRSRRRRYNITTTTTTTTSTTIASSSLSLVHTSTTCVSEIEQEQEEVALCLMMLSRDVGGGGYWGGLNSVVDFSDNDSVVVEVRSSGLVDEKKVLMNGEKIVKMKKPRARKLEFGLKKVESEVSVHGFFGGDSSKRPKLDFEVFEAEKSRVQCTGSELIKDLIKEDQADSMCVKYNNSSKRTIDDVYNTPKKSKYDGLDESEIGKSSRKKPKYECTTCNKTFHSYQALGGHRASHKRIKGCSLLKLESSENSIDTDIKLIKDCSIEKLMMDHKEKQVVVLAESSSVSKNSNKHECPTCFKVFLSGQALGGHKRSHVIESSDIRGGNVSINAVQQKLPEIQDLLDLNLPAPIEDDMKDDHIGFKPWWVGSNLTHEAPPVSMISH